MIVEILLMIVTFLLCNWVGWLFTEVYQMPKFLRFRPWTCTLCLRFWLTIFAGIVIVLTLGYNVTAIGLAILAILNAIAMWLDQKKKTVDITTYKLEEE